MAMGAIAAFWLAGPSVWPTPPAPGHILYQLPAKAGVGLDTPPTPAQAARVSQVTGVVSTDGVATTVTITHNLEIPAEDLTNGLPEVRLEVIDQNFYEETPFISSKTENTVVITVAGNEAISFGFQIDRPNTRLL